MSEKLRYHAEHEALTKLSNRSLFHKQLQQEINAARKKSHSFALCVLGLDRFRELNHTFGPLAGDLLLREVGRRFASATGNCRARAWLGGAEFAALFPASVETGIGVVCTDILSMLATPFLAQDVPVDLSGSIGVAFFPKHGEQANLLLQRASIALDRAKDAGHDYAFYEPENDPYSQRKLAYLSGIRIAIEQNQLILHYQPKIDMKTKRTCGIEALVRWNHPQIGLVPPVEFVSIAERTGLIHTLSRWVLRAALGPPRFACPWTTGRNLTTILRTGFRIQASRGASMARFLRCGYTVRPSSSTVGPTWRFSSGSIASTEWRRRSRTSMCPRGRQVACWTPSRSTTSGSSRPGLDSPTSTPSTSRTIGVRSLR